MRFLLDTETEIDENIANLASGAVGTLATLAYASFKVKQIKITFKLGAFSNILKEIDPPILNLKL